MPTATPTCRERGPASLDEPRAGPAPPIPHPSLSRQTNPLLRTHTPNALAGGALQPEKKGCATRADAAARARGAAVLRPRARSPPLPPPPCCAPLPAPATRFAGRSATSATSPRTSWARPSRSHVRGTRTRRARARARPARLRCLRRCAAPRGAAPAGSAAQRGCARVAGNCFSAARHRRFFFRMGGDRDRPRAQTKAKAKRAETENASLAGAAARNDTRAAPRARARAGRKRKRKRKRKRSASGRHVHAHVRSVYGGVGRRRSESRRCGADTAMHARARPRARLALLSQSPSSVSSTASIWRSSCGHSLRSATIRGTRSCEASPASCRGSSSIRGSRST